MGVPPTRESVLGVGGPVSVSVGTTNIGNSGGTAGNLTIQNGSTLTTTGQARMGGTTTGIGTVTVTGPGSQWNITSINMFYVGFLGAGTLNIQNGGQVATPLIGIVLGGSGTASGTLNISGGGTLETQFLRGGPGASQANFDNGILRATASNATFIAGFTGTELNILAGGLTIDTAGFTVGTDAASGFTGTGGLTVTSTAPGGVTVPGGVFNLLSNSTYLGETWVQSGSTLSLQGAGAIANSSKVTADGTFDVSGITGTGTIIQSLAGGSSGAVTLGAKNLTITNANDTFAGAIGGTGGLTISGGTQTLSGTNTYSGGTTLTGGTLAVNSDAALGDVSGALTFNGGALATTVSFDMMRQIVLTGDGVFRPTAGTALTLGTAMTGPGDVVLDGPGELIFGTAQSYAGDTIINGGTLSAGGAHVFSSASTHNVMAGGTLDLAGFDQTLASLDNAGTVNLGGAPGTKLTVNGNYVGRGGTMTLNTVLGDDASLSDQLIIGTGGNASGVTSIVVTNVGGAGAQTTGAGIAVVVAQTGATTAVGAFTAAPVAAGPFQYLLFRGNDSGSTGDPNTWYLRSHCEGPDCPQPTASPTAFYRPETSIYGALPGMARALAISTVGTFHERYGDQDAVRSGGGRAWGRVFGEHNEQGSTGALNSSFEGWLGGVQLGIDAFRWRGDDGAQDAGGFFFTLAKADGDVHGNVIGVADAYAGSSDLSGPSFGAYYTHIGPGSSWYGNWYVDSLAMVTFYEADGVSTNAVDTNVGGSGAFLSLEGGVPLALGLGVTLEPQGQLIYQHLDFGGTTDPFSTLSFDTADVLTGRLGLRLAAELGAAWHPYLKANLWQDWADGNDHTIYAATNVLSSEEATTALEVGGGLVGALSDTLSVWGVVDYTTDVADNDLEVIRGNLGVKVGW